MPGKAWVCIDLLLNGYWQERREVIFFRMFLSVDTPLRSLKKKVSRLKCICLDCFHSNLAGKKISPDSLRLQTPSVVFWLFMSWLPPSS